MVWNCNRIINFLIKQLVFIVNFWNCLWIKIWWRQVVVKGTLLSLAPTRCQYLLINHLGVAAIEENTMIPQKLFHPIMYLVVAYKQLSPAFERFYMINEVANPNFLLFYSVFTDCCFKKEKYFGIFVFAVQKLSRKCITLL